MYFDQDGLPVTTVRKYFTCFGKDYVDRSSFYLPGSGSGYIKEEAVDYTIEWIKK